MTKTFDLLEHDNLGEVVYGKLSDALIKGRLAPDSRLTIRELAQSLGTSVTPVRDAILRLIQDEGLIQKSARDVRVPVLTVERYKEILQIRVKLEGLAARECALKATPADIAVLRDLVKRNDRAFKSKNWTEAIDLNQTFHFALAEIANMTVLRGILHRLWLQMGPLIAVSYSQGGRVMFGQHNVVLEAIEARDADAAERAIIADIGDAATVIIERISSYGGDLKGNEA